MRTTSLFKDQSASHLTGSYGLPLGLKTERNFVVKVL